MSKPQARKKGRRFVAKQRSEQWQELALGSAGGKVPPQQGRARSPNEPWSLTKEFNKSAEQTAIAADNPKRKKEVAKLRDQMIRAANENKLAKGVERTPWSHLPASQKTINKLRNMLSRPQNTFELTPLGSATRGINSDRDRMLTKEIKRMQKELKLSRSMKQERRVSQKFNRSSGMSM